MNDISSVLHDYDKFVDFTKSLEKLQRSNSLYQNTGEVIKENNPEYHCFLKNHPGAADFFYEQSHGYLCMRYFEPQRSVHLSIQTIDDGGIVFHGPSESLEQVKIRIEKLKIQIESWAGWIPTEEQCREVEKKCGMYWNR